jgi:hypothetical protein
MDLAARCTAASVLGDKAVLALREEDLGPLLPDDRRRGPR